MIPDDRKADFSEEPEKYSELEEWLLGTFTVGLDAVTDLTTCSRGH